MTQFYDQKRQRWRYQFTAHRRRYTGGGYPTKKAAREAEAVARAEAARQPIRSPQWRTFGDLVGGFLSASRRTKSPAWTYQLKVKIARAFPPLMDVDARALTRGHFEPILNSLAEHRKPRTVNEYRKIAVSILQYGKDLEILDRNVAARIPKMPEPESEVRPIDTVTLRKLIVGAAQDEKTLLIVLASTGCRWVEAARLRWTDVHLDADTPYAILRTRKNRGGHERTRPQPLSDLAVEAIAARIDNGSRYVFPGPDGGPLLYETSLKRLRALCLRVTVAPIGFHAIRHWAGTETLRLSRNLKATSKFLGHQHVRTTERYVHAVPAEVRQVATDLATEIGSNLGVTLPSTRRPKRA